MNQSVDYRQINGWGIDADPKKRPYFPVHKIQPNTGAHWSQPDNQVVDFEVLKTSELPRLSAVVGTSVPPSGLSGIIRRFAFRYSENEYLHWMPLLLADRINVVEGVLSDLMHGHVPNFFAEMGLAADWKYDRKRYYKRVTKMAAAVVVPALVLYFLVKRKERENRL